MIKIIILSILILLSCNKIDNLDKKTSNNVKADNINKKDTKKIYKIDYSKKDKRLWAKSFLGKKAPELITEGWISKKPNTKGKFILLDFWGTSCPQCKRAIPELNKIQKKFKDKLVVIGLSTSSKESIQSMKSPKIDYYSAYDPAGRTKRKYQVRGIPHVVIINPDGIVAWEGFPFLNTDPLTEELVDKIINY